MRTAWPYVAGAALFGIPGLLLSIRPQSVEETILDFYNSLPQPEALKPFSSGEPSWGGRVVLRVVGIGLLILGCFLAAKGIIAFVTG